MKKRILIIPTGYTGVKTSFGQIQQEPIQSGTVNFTIPFVESIHKVNNKQQDKRIEAQIWGEASDKTPVYASDVIVTYQVLPEKSAWIYANVSDIKNLIGEETTNPPASGSGTTFRSLKPARLFSVISIRRRISSSEIKSDDLEVPIIFSLMEAPML